MDAQRSVFVNSDCHGILELVRTSRQDPQVGLHVTLAVALGQFVAIALARSNLPRDVRSGFALLSLVLLAPAVGAIFRLHRAWDWPTEFALRYGLGNLLLLVAATALSALDLFTIERINIIAALAAIASLPAALLLARASGDDMTVEHRPSSAASIFGAIVVMLVAVLFARYWREFSPVPFHPAWDELLHLGAARRIAEAGIFHLSVQQLNPNFVFDPYLPGFHLRLAMASGMSGVPILYMLWAGPFVIGMSTALALYSLCLRVSRNPLMSAGATSLAPFVAALRKAPAPFMYTLPVTEAVMLTPLVLVALTGGDDTRRRLTRPVVLITLMLPLHGLHGLLLLGVAGAGLLVSLMVNASTVRRAACAFSVGMGVGASYLYISGANAASLLPASFLIDPFGGYSDLTPDSGLRRRLDLVTDWFPRPILGASCVLLAVWVAMRLFRERRAHWLAATLFAAFIGYFVPVAGLERLHALFFAAVAVPMAFFGDLVERQLRAPRPMVAALRHGRYAVFAVTALLLLPPLAEPIRRFRQYQLSDTGLTGLVSSFAPYELSGIPAVAPAPGSSTVVVSDPITQLLLDGFGLATTVGGQGTDVNVQRDIAAALNSETVEATRTALLRLNERYANLELVVTGRALRWAYLYPEPRAFDGVFRPWSLSALPTPPVKTTTAHLTARIVSTNCVERLVQRPEIRVFTIRCR